MPALSKKRRAALTGVQTKQNAVATRAESKDTSYLPPSTDEEDDSEQTKPSKKRRFLTDGQLEARKRRRENGDLVQPGASAIKGESRSAVWQEKKGLTKKSRAKNGQASVATIFKIQATNPKSTNKGNTGIPDHLSIKLVAQPQMKEITVEEAQMEEVQVEEVRVEDVHEIMDVDAVEIQTELESGRGPESTEVEEMGQSVDDDDDGYSTTQSDNEREKTMATQASIEHEHQRLAKALKVYEKKFCTAKQIAASGSNAKMADRLVMVSGLKAFNDERRKRSLQRLADVDRLRLVPGPQRPKLRQKIAKQKPALAASKCIAARFSKSNYFATKLRSAAIMLEKTGELPDNKHGQGGAHKSHIDNPEVKSRLRVFLKGDIPVEEGGFVGRIRPEKMRRYVNQFLFNELGIEDTIGITTATLWLKKLGYRMRRYAKGIYYDGHERPDVVKKRKEFIDFMQEHVTPYTYQYETVVDEETGKKYLKEIAPTIPEGHKIRYPIYQDETSTHANDQAHFVWETEDEHEIRSKSRGRIVHVSGFVIEHCGWLRLTPEEIAEEEKLPKRPLSPAEIAAAEARAAVVAAAAAAEAEKQRLLEEQRAASGKGKGRKKGTGGGVSKKTKKTATKETPATDRTTVGVDWTPPPPPAPFKRYRCDTYEANRIIHPGANHDPWWDMPQLIAQASLLESSQHYPYRF
ncbi:DDE family endonuclease [Mycena indigotica]|uniref:DDE family endonuclease n=1 Tax=Mycena indigotica TaxID=2126181 RepID=A0A8H6T3K4_9AGAR|nr:DDE family endonuclease [Mycena indigotica]KAF7310230.1 DDE family endonuclease [Mycena indigotica]